MADRVLVPVGNGWLDGRSPEEALGDEDGVLNAAERLREPAIG